MTDHAEQRVFVSYSHDDAPFVDRLIADLSAAGIHIWTDRTGLMPGMPNWEQAIREAIREASAVLLVATPAARLSLAVQGEVSLARSQRVRVIPLWADGADWYECVALEMVSYHYLDCRGERYQSALARLIPMLSEAGSRGLPPAPAAPSTASVRHGQILVDINQATTGPGLPIPRVIGTTIFDAVNDVYMDFLWDTFPPYTYGVQWILASKSRGVQRLVAPWTWLLMGGPGGQIDQQTAASLYREWGGLPPETFGLVDGTQWEVLNVSSGRGHMRSHIPIIGLATNNGPLAQLVRDLPVASGHAALRAAAKLTGFVEVFVDHIATGRGHYEDKDGLVRVVPPESLIPDKYPFVFLFTGLATSFNGKAIIVETSGDRGLPGWL